LIHSAFLTPSWGGHSADPEEKREPRLARPHAQQQSLTLYARRSSALFQAQQCRLSAAVDAVRPLTQTAIEKLPFDNVRDL
jgi:hypothetical protein